MCAPTRYQLDHGGRRDGVLEWGWGKLILEMTAKSPAPDLRLQMIHCNCSGWCNALRCTCRKHALEYPSACGYCQDGNCDNMPNKPVAEVDEEQVGI